MTRHPQRRRKSDRLINPGATSDEIRCDHALAPFDRLAREMERKWGIDQLPGLVSVDTAARWGSAMAKLNAAIEASDPDETSHRAAVCMRGLEAMDAEATAAGHPPVTWWEGEVYSEGQPFRFAIVDEMGHWPVVKEKRPDLSIHSMHEVGVALLMIQKLGVDAIKDKFPGAEVQFVKPRVAELPDSFDHSVGDEIPF